MHRRTVLGAAASLSLTGCLRLTGGESDSSDERSFEETGEADIWVAPGDGESGDGTSLDPIRDLQHALNIAEPGDTIALKSGEYRRNISTTNGGEPGNPITLTGPPDAVVRPEEGETTLFGILHSHFHVTGLTFDGLMDEDRMDDKSAWASDIAHISPGPRYEEGVDYLEDVVFEPHAVGNTGFGMVGVARTRNASIGDFEVNGPAGAAFHPKMEDPVKAHWAHLVSVGTSPPHIEDDMPWDTLDRTRDVRVHHIDNSAGYHHSIFVTMRTGTENVTVEYCTARNSGNRSNDKEHVPAIDVGGNNCTVRGNDLGDCRQGIEFGAWTPTEMADAEDWARNNDVYRNRLQSVEKSAFTFHDSTPEAQRTLCDNRLVGIDSEEYAYATGECGGDVPDVDGIGHTAGQ